MRINIITLFPEMFSGPFDHSIIGRAQKNKLVKINFVNLREFGLGSHKMVDDRPYSGGVGMVLMVEPMYKALKHLKVEPKTKSSKIILLTPRGKKFDQSRARNYSKLKTLTLICGHYEGFDQRIADHLVDEEISIGDYVLTGGEIPAMAIVDSVARLIPGVLSKPEATQYESFTKKGQIEHPQYTRPENFMGWKVPQVLLSGHHKNIQDWKEKTS